MPLVLAIETAGSNCSAAVARGGTVLAAEARAMRHGHAEALLPMIDRVMRAAGMQPRRLDCVAAALGPGGFTGIRVGLAAAQGIARATGARLVGVTSFAAVAVCLDEAGCLDETGEETGGGARAVLVALDSRREDLYVQLFGRAGAVALAAPRAVLPEALADHVRAIVEDGAAGPLLIAGDAAAIAAGALGGHLDYQLAGGLAGALVPDARGVAAAALRQLGSDAADQPPRPLYLRPPDVTLPRPTPPVAAPR